MYTVASLLKNSHVHTTTFTYNIPSHTTYPLLEAQPSRLHLTNDTQTVFKRIPTARYTTEATVFRTWNTTYITTPHLQLTQRSILVVVRLSIFMRAPAHPQNIYLKPQNEIRSFQKVTRDWEITKYSQD